MKFILKKDNIDYTLFKAIEISPEIKDCYYEPLAKALLKVITNNQLIEITRPNNVILFDDLIRCFHYVYVGNRFDFSLINKCICGVKIEEHHHIKNVENGDIHVVGSTCREHWTLTRNEKKKIRMEKEQDIISLCYFCNKNTSNNRCKSCNQKKLIQTVFNNWRKIIKHKFALNKYKHLNKSYYFICSSYNRNFGIKKYLNWVLSDKCQTSIANKELIKNLID